MVEERGHEKTDGARIRHPRWRHTSRRRTGGRHQWRLRVWRVAGALLRRCARSRHGEADEHAVRSAARAQNLRHLGALLAAACGRLAGVMTATKYVASHTMTSHEWQPAVFLGGDVAEQVAELKQQPGPNLHVYGSANLVQTLM